MRLERARAAPCVVMYGLAVGSWDWCQVVDLDVLGMGCVTLQIVAVWLAMTWLFVRRFVELGGMELLKVLWQGEGQGQN